MGIAAAIVTEAAKSAAGRVLTNPGLAGIVAAVKEGRLTSQRIQTYTINFWLSPHASRWLVASSVVDLGSAFTLAGCGWIMRPLPMWLPASVLTAAFYVAFSLKFLKEPVFSRLKIA